MTRQQTRIYSRPMFWITPEGGIRAAKVEIFGNLGGPFAGVDEAVAARDGHTDPDAKRTQK